MRLVAFWQPGPVGARSRTMARRLREGGHHGWAGEAGML